MNSKKNGRKDEEREDPFKRILSEFERMSKSIDEMMKRELSRNESTHIFNETEHPENQTISFSFSIEQGPEGIVIKPTQPSIEDPEDEEDEMTDVIEKEDHIDVLMEINEENDSNVKTKLTNEDELEVTSREGTRIIKLPRKARSIEKKQLKNGVLQVKILKKDQDA